MNSEKDYVNIVDSLNDQANELYVKTVILNALLLDIVTKAHEAQFVDERLMESIRLAERELDGLST